MNIIYIYIISQRIFFISKIKELTKTIASFIDSIERDCKQTY